MAAGRTDTAGVVDLDVAVVANKARDTLAGARGVHPLTLAHHGLRWGVLEALTSRAFSPKERKAGFMLWSRVDAACFGLTCAEINSFRFSPLVLTRR